MRSKILGIIQDMIDEESKLLEKPIDRSGGESTLLYGSRGQLDSMGLVSLVVAVEQEIEAKLNCRVTLVSDRAVSSRHSPFATLGSFTDYVVSQVELAEREVAERV